MNLTHLGIASDGGGRWELHETASYTSVVRGSRIGAPEALAALRTRGLPDHEPPVEMPKTLLAFALKDFG